MADPFSRLPSPFSVWHPKFVIIDDNEVFLPSCNVSWEVSRTLLLSSLPRLCCVNNTLAVTRHLYIQTCVGIEGQPADMIAMYRCGVTALLARY